jgi:polygalacturonase
MLSVYKVSNLQIQGNGTISGQGAWWWNNKLENLLPLIDCHSMEILSLGWIASPFWCIHPVLSQYMHVHHVTIQATPVDIAKNTDAIDPDSSKHVLIEYNDVHVGDNNVTIKASICGSKLTNNCNDIEWSNGDYASYNITIRHNTFRAGHGISIGSEMSGVVSDVLIENNTIALCDDSVSDDNDAEYACSTYGVCLKTSPTQSGYIENVTMSSNTIFSASMVWFLTDTTYTAMERDYNDQPLPNRMTRISNISLLHNRGMGNAIEAIFGCSSKIMCMNVTVGDNVTGNVSPQDAWECSYIESYKVSKNDPSGLDVCMSQSMNMLGNHDYHSGDDSGSSTSDDRTSATTRSWF